jgi:TRAP-type C4-dicarboxylate transport system permease small subunit
MKKIGVVIHKVTDIVAMVSIAGVVLLMLLNVVDAVITKLFATSILGAYEISENVLMCTVFAAFAYGQTKKTHVHMTLIIGKLPGRIKFIPYALCSLISTAMAVALAYAAFYQAARKLATSTVTGILHFPVYPFYYVNGVCLILFSLVIFYDTIISVLAIFRKDYAAVVSSNW